MEIIFTNHKINEETIDFVLHHNLITGITNDTENIIYNLLTLKKIGKGQIVINKEKITKEDLYIYQRRISEIKDDIQFSAYINTVSDLMYQELKLYNLNVKNPEKKIEDSLKIVGLSKDLATRQIITLSTSEKKLITIALGLLSNPDTIIIEEPFRYLDLKQEKRLFFLLQKLKEQYNKTIIIKCEDPNLLYKYTDEVFIVKNNNIILGGDTKEVYQRVDFLRRNSISIPDCVAFTYLANKKDAKIDYHRDIRDIIKDIYKHV